MTLKESASQLSLRIAALIVLVGVFSIGPVFAEDGGSGGLVGGGARLAAPANVTQPSSAGGNAGAGAKLSDAASANGRNEPGKGASGEGARQGGNDVAGDGHPSLQGTDGSDAIDASISVLPRRPGSGRGKVGDMKTTISPLFGAHFHSRRYFAPGVSHRFVRNAIGALIARREGAEPDMGRRDYRSGIQGVAPGTANRWPHGRLDRPTPNTSPIVKPAISSGAAINGSKLKRPGIAPAKIGGANTALSGINGTTIRRKY